VAIKVRKQGFPVAKKPKTLGTLHELAGALGIPTSTVGRWVRHDDWKWARRGPWDSRIVREVLAWAEERLQRGRPEGTLRNSELRREKLIEEIRRTRAMADTEEISLTKYRGGLVDAGEVARGWAEVKTIITGIAEGIPAQIAPMAMACGMPTENEAKFLEGMKRNIAHVLAHLDRHELNNGREAKV
jgi:phage terminase Nu1 subunit (DNA packaging protein)